MSNAFKTFRPSGFFKNDPDPSRGLTVELSIDNSSVWLTEQDNNVLKFATKLTSDTARQLGIELMRQADLADERNERGQSDRRPKS